MILLATMMMLVAASTPDRLYGCSDDQVRELHIAGDEGESWRWTASTAADLSIDFRSTLMKHIDDCKPVDNGRAILVTASTGGAVIIDRASGHVLFHARVPMAHSAALLPRGLVAVALSIHPDGDRLAVYDRRNGDEPLQTFPLPSGHGVVWDPSRRRLFTLSHDLIQAFVLNTAATGPQLAETARWTLPGRHDGHDLSLRPQGGYYVTTDDGVWQFDPDTGGFSPVTPLNPALRVKAVSAVGDRLAWVQAEDSWWAYGFTLANADGSQPRRVPVKGLHLYKVRLIP